MVRLQVTLEKDEADLLAQWAALEMRDPRDQIRFIIRERLIERGLHPHDALPDQPARSAQPQHQAARS